MLVWRLQEELSKDEAEKVELGRNYLELLY